MNEDDRHFCDVLCALQHFNVRLDLSPAAWIPFMLGISRNSNSSSGSNSSASNSQPPHFFNVFPFSLLGLNLCLWCCICYFFAGNGAGRKSNGGRGGVGNAHCGGMWWWIGWPNPGMVSPKLSDESKTTEKPNRESAYCSLIEGGNRTFALSLSPPPCLRSFHVTVTRPPMDNPDSKRRSPFFLLASRSLELTQWRPEPVLSNREILHIRVHAFFDFWWRLPGTTLEEGRSFWVIAESLIAGGWRTRGLPAPAARSATFLWQW